MIRRGLNYAGRPGDLPELFLHEQHVGFCRAFGEFLDEFYVEPCQEALSTPPPAGTSPEMRAFLAGTVEALAEAWELERPLWAAQEVLPQPIVWEVLRGAFPPEDEPRLRPIIEKQTPEAFRRHGILVRASVLNRC